MWKVLVFFRRGTSAGFGVLVLMSTFLASNAFSAVVPSGMICCSTRSSLTLFASRNFAFLVSVRDASCFHADSANGPSVTMFPGSVHFSPYFSTVALCTARNAWWDSSWMNQGCGEVSLILSVYLSGAVIPTLALSALQSAFAASQLLYASAPAMPKNGSSEEH